MRSTRWYVTETLPRAESIAQSNLERQGFASFCPRFRKVRRHARRVENVLAPLFPSYVFVRFDPGRDPWRSVNGTTGIRRLVGPPAGLPQAMPYPVMEALFARCEQGVVRCALPELEPGRQVRLVGGPFARQLALIESLDDKGRVRVLLDILGGLTPVSVAPGDLAPA